MTFYKRQSSGRERKIKKKFKKSKNTVKEFRIMHNSSYCVVRAGVCVCACMCVEGSYICVLLYVDVYVIFSMCVHDDTSAVR